MKEDFTSIDDSDKRFNPIPCLFTLCNALCGFTSILYTMAAYGTNEPIPIISLILVGVAMFFDVLDGLAARALKAQSIHGMNLDSMADVVSFGVAPACIIYRVVQGANPPFGLIHSLGWFAAAFYLGCVLWRLAAYNTLKAEEEDDSGDFVGLPSPGAAAVVCGMVIVVPLLGLGQLPALIVYITYSIISAILMVSAVPYAHVRRALTHSNKWFRIGFIALFISSVVVFHLWALVIWAHLYVLYGPLWSLETRLVGHVQKIRSAGISPNDAD